MSSTNNYNGKRDLPSLPTAASKKQFIAREGEVVIPDAPVAAASSAEDNLNATAISPPTAAAVPKVTSQAPVGLGSSTHSHDSCLDLDGTEDDDDEDNLPHARSLNLDGLAIKCISAVGTINYSNGNVYKGSYRSLFKPDGTPKDELQPKPHGEGKLTNENGQLVCEGIWVDGALHLDDKTISVEEEDTIYYKNGNIYKGAIKNFKPHGVGTMIYA